MPLNWLLGDVIADGNTYLPPKQMALLASELDEPPSTFDIFMLHDPAVRQVMRHLGLAELQLVGGINAEETGKNRYQPSQKWSLPLDHRALKKSAAFIFLDSASGHRTGVVSSTRKARAEISKKWNVWAKVPYTPISGEHHHDVEFTVFWAVDPEMRIRILCAAELAQYVLALATEDQGGENTLDRDDRGHISATLEELRSAVAEVSQPPFDWILHGPPEIHGEAGETSHLQVQITAPSVGLRYFVLALFDPSNPESDEMSSICAVEVTQDEQGRKISIVADFDDRPLQLLTYA